jgi:4-amino-4-deoxy-L-arabinose transferase-like glycosyltransferase
MVQLTSVYFISFSRKAEVDMLLCLLTTLALFLVANGKALEIRRSKAFRWIGIYTLIGRAWLAKFHYGPALVLGVIFVWHVVDRKRPGFWDVFNPVGLGILAASVVIWPWLLLRRVPEAWDIWQTETIGRALGELGREPVWFYIPQIVVQALPWSFLLWTAGKDSYRRAWKEGDRRERFLWVWFFTQLAILTASAFKHHHYLMAAMPALSLILGRTLHKVWSSLRDGTIPFGRKHIVLLIGGYGTVGGTVAVGVSLRWPHLQSAAVMLGLIIAASGLLIGYLASMRLWTPALIALGIGFVASYAIATATIFPNRDRRLPYVEFAKSVREAVPANKVIVLYGLKEDPLVYYLDGPVCRAESATDLAKWIERENAVVVTDQAHLPEIKSAESPIDTLAVLPGRLGDSVPLVLVKRIPHRLLSTPLGH